MVVRLPLKMLKNVCCMFKITCRGSQYTPKQRLLGSLSAIVIVTVWIYGFCEYYMRYYGECSLEETVKRINEMCWQYENNLMLGDMCEPLCATKTLQYTNCIAGRGSNKYVYTATLNNTPAMLKIVTFRKIRTNIWNKIYTMEKFKSKLARTAERTLQIPQKDFKFDSFIQKMWPFHINWTSPYLNVTLGNINYLVTQGEYMFSKYYTDVANVPKILGSCGYMYITEQHHALSEHMWPWVKMYYYSWRYRAKLALKFLDMIDKLDAHSPPLYHCDIKLRNFGVSKSGELTLLDTDSIWRAYSHRDSSCRYDSDCWLIYCDLNCIDKHCVVTPYSNIKAVCDRVYYHEELLHHPPPAIASDLKATLKECLKLNRTLSVPPMLDELPTVIQPKSHVVRMKFHQLLNKALK